MNNKEFLQILINSIFSLENFLKEKYGFLETVYVNFTYDDVKHVYRRFSDDSSIRFYKGKIQEFDFPQDPHDNGKATNVTDSIPTMKEDEVKFIVEMIERLVKEIQREYQSHYLSGSIIRIQKLMGP